MENIFGIKDEYIDKALREGILIITPKGTISNCGILSLTFDYINKKYIFVYGNTAANASFVNLEDINITWRLKDEK